MHASPECTPPREFTPPRVPLLAGYPLGAAALTDRPRARRGFTLTEMLVVIAIIAILASLTSVAVVRALDTAKQTRIKLEVDNLDLALKNYKEKYGSYPPANITNPAANLALRQHVARVFPRYNMGAGYVNLKNDLTTAGVDVTNFRPDQALVFWLRGFGPDPLNPFLTVDDLPIVNGAPGTIRVTRTSFFDFDKTRLILNSSAAGNQLPSYFSAGMTVSTTPGAPFPVWSGGGAPYVYFTYVDLNGAGYGLPSSGLPPLNAHPRTFNAPATTYFAGAGTAAPYWLDTSNDGIPDVPPTEGWANPDSFQIIAPGMDGKYGPVNPDTVGGPPSIVARLYPTGTHYDRSTDLADDDNITNFCAKARLIDAKP